ncbi:MAG: hypothetical protein RJB14_1156 [Pseudomonadota bacterium]|jgi:hypothetical protein
MTLQMTVIRCVAFYCAIDAVSLGQMHDRQPKVNTIACQMLHGRDNGLDLK